MFAFPAMKHTFSCIALLTNLFLPPLGVFGTVEMRPPTVGTWLVECTIGDYQLAGMRAKLLVYDPSTCNVL